MRPLTAPKGPHLEAILTCIVYPKLGRHLPWIGLCPWGLCWSRGCITDNTGKKGRAELLFKFWSFPQVGQHSIGLLLCIFRQSPSSIEVKLHLLWVTFTRPFRAEWDSLLAFRGPFLFWVFPTALPIPGIYQFLSDHQWIAQHLKYLVAQLGSAWISASHTRCCGWTGIS